MGYTSILTKTLMTAAAGLVVSAPALADQRRGGPDYSLVQTALVPTASAFEVSQPIDPVSACTAECLGDQWHPLVSSDYLTAYCASECEVLNAWALRYPARHRGARGAAVRVIRPVLVPPPSVDELYNACTNVRAIWSCPGSGN